MFNENVLKFQKYLESNPQILDSIRKKNKSISAGNVDEFITKKIIPIAKKAGFNLKKEDFLLKSPVSLDEDDLENISGGVKLGTMIGVGMLVFSSSVLGAMALKNSGTSISDLLPVSTKVFQEGTLREDLGDKDNDYEEMIKKEIDAKAKEQNKGVYPKDKKSSKLSKYGFGDYQNQRGTLVVPEGEGAVKKLEDPELQFAQLKGKKNMSAKTHKYRDESPLFRHAPVIGDIHQGSMGNCYFESTMISMLSSENGSQKILETMTDNGDGTVTVRLFDSNKKAHYFKVDKSVPKIETGKDHMKILNTKNHVIWPAILFKAYVAALSQDGFENFRNPDIKNKSNSLSYEDAESGNPSDILQSIFGLFSSDYVKISENISKNEGYSRSELKILIKTEKALKSQQAVCAGSREKGKLTKKGLNAEHAFAVVNIKHENSKHYIGLVDPWREKSGFDNEKDKFSGFFYMELSEFCKNFGSLNIGR